MDFLEKDLEDILFNSDARTIRLRGLTCFVYNHIHRQVDLKQYGIADLITIHLNEKHIHFHVYELKNKVLNPAAFWQIVRYIKGVQHALSKCNLKNHSLSVSGTIIGRSLDLNTDLCFLPSIMPLVSMYLYSYTLEGMQFDKVYNSYTNSGFEGIKLNQFYCYSPFDFYKTYLIDTTSKVDVENIF